MLGLGSFYFLQNNTLTGQRANGVTGPTDLEKLLEVGPKFADGISHNRPDLPGEIAH